MAIDDKLDASKANWFAALHSQSYLLVPGLFAHLQNLDSPGKDDSLSSLFCRN